MSVLIQPSRRGFGGESFMRMMANDTAATPSRYDDICGPHIGNVMSRLDWAFGEAPVTISLCSPAGEPLATGFAAPIRMRAQAQAQRGWHGINLSYAVHSQHEGHGYGLAVSCLVIQEAASIWGARLQERAFMNIQTRQGNGRSNSLMRLLSGDAAVEDASFSVQLPSGERLDYSGSRVVWSKALAIAEDHLLNMPFLSEVSVDTAQQDAAEHPAG